MGRSSRSLPLARAVLLGFLAAAACGSNHSPSGPEALPSYHPKTRMLVFSDSHYFDPSLGTTGAAFRTYVEHDRKLIAESDAIARAMVGAVEAENPELVLVSGDLTKDGERVSHLAAASYLRQMKAAGRRVFVVPGNHDIQNAGASRYDGDQTTPVETISAAEFASIYADLGFGEAIARDPSSLSYVAELVPGLWLFALDSCIYGDSPAPENSNGRFLEGTLRWIKEQLDLAKTKGVRVIGMMHHGLVEHFDKQALVFSPYLVADHDAVGALLSGGGMGLIFTGHFHANDITQGVPAGATQSMFDVETGSAVTYPCPYRIVDVVADSVAIQTKHITAIDYDLEGAVDFQSYARGSLRLGMETLIATLIEAPPYSFSASDAAALSPWLGDGLVGHYLGDEVLPPDAGAEIQTLLASPSFYTIFAGAMLKSIWTDLPPADNTLTIDLAMR